jgi:hypothetical protein
MMNTPRDQERIDTIKMDCDMIVHDVMTRAAGSLSTRDGILPPTMVTVYSTTSVKDGRVSYIAGTGSIGKRR